MGLRQGDGANAFPCRGLATKYKTECYWMMGNASKNMPWSQQVSVCSSIERSWVPVCVYSLGVATQRVGMPMASTCLTIGDHRNECIFGALSNAINLRLEQPSFARSLCASIPESRTACARFAGAVLATRGLSPGETKRMCDQIAGKKLGSACLEQSHEPKGDTFSLAETAARLAKV